MSNDKKYHLEVGGLTLSTDDYSENLTAEQCEDIRQNIYKKPDLKDVFAELIKIGGGSSNITKVTNYYVREFMHIVKLWHSKWSIQEVLSSDDLIRVFHAKTLKNKNVFTGDVYENIRTALRVGGKGIAQKPSNFDPSVVQAVLKKYCLPYEDCAYYDYSSGWGARLLGSLGVGVAYHSTDPNEPVVKALLEMLKNFRKLNKYTKTVDMRIQGSETFVPDWENNMTVAFSSPPYFLLEKYSDDDRQSAANRSYDEWLEEYWRGTCKNIHRYLKAGGFFILNMSNYKKFELVGDMRAIMESEGFEFVRIENMNVITRPNLEAGDTDEGMYVYKKAGELIKKESNSLDEFFG